MNALTRNRSLTVTTTLALALALTACSSDDPSTGTGDTTGDPSGTDPTTSATDPDTTGTDTTPTDNCGNDMVDADEECDGTDLDGKSCPDIDAGYIGGTLACGATCTFDASACELSPGVALVMLNELTSESIVASGMNNDAIEIYNGGGVAADISGWKISDDPTLPGAKTYVFPAGTMIDGGEFLVLLSYDMVSGTGDLPFGIANDESETISLADADGVILDQVMVDGQKARVSYCRIPDASGPWFQCEQTFGAENVVAATACGNDVIEDAEQCDGTELGGATCEGLGLGYSGGTIGCTLGCNLDADACTTDSELVLNELNATSDDIEIFNGSDTEVDLSGWVLTDDEVDAAYDPTVDLAELVFAPGTTLAPGAYLVVSVGLGPGQHPFGLGLNGDTITLADPAGPTVIDQVTYDDGDATISYCRQPNGPGGAWTAACTPSMGAAN
jgi:hypothetical protein